MSDQLKELEQNYKRSQIALAKATKNNNVASYLLFEAKTKESIPLVNPAKKRVKKEPSSEKKEKKEKKEKSAEPPKKRGRPAAPKKEKEEKKSE